VIIAYPPQSVAACLSIVTRQSSSHGHEIERKHLRRVNGASFRRTVLTTVENLRKKVIEYTNQHSELGEAHHYDFAITLTGAVDYFVMGLNPGETDQDRQLRSGKGHFNPYDKPPFSRSSKAWQTRSKNLLGTEDLLYGDFFFWSSSDTGRSFVDRFGTSLEKSPHLSFCTSMIGQLVDFYKPKALIIPGLKLATIVPSLYGPISYVCTRKHGKTRLIEHYADGVRPWLFVKHYRRLSKPEMTTIKAYLASLNTGVAVRVPA
jgi:hypothetical protein